MILDGEPSIGMPSPKKYIFKKNIMSLTLTFEPMTLIMSSCHVDLELSNCDEFR